MVERLKRRQDFLATAKGYKAVRNGFVLEARERDPGHLGQARAGLTVTKRVAPKAVERNRMRRRLKALLLIAQDALAPGHDYVLVARRGALSEDFADLRTSLASALRQVHRHRDPSRKDREQNLSS